MKGANDNVISQALLMGSVSCVYLRPLNMGSIFLNVHGFKVCTVKSTTKVNMQSLVKGRLKAISNVLCH